MVQFDVRQIVPQIIPVFVCGRMGLTFPGVKVASDVELGALFFLDS